MNKKDEPSRPRTFNLVCHTAIEKTGGGSKEEHAANLMSKMALMPRNIGPGVQSQKQSLPLVSIKRSTCRWYTVGNRAVNGWHPRAQLAPPSIPLQVGLENGK
jgi:hypothetical protein